MEHIQIQTHHITCCNIFLHVQSLWSAKRYKNSSLSFTGHHFILGGKKKEKTKQEGSNNHDEKQTMKKEQDNGCDAEKSSKTVNLPLWCPHLFTSVVQPLIVYSRCLSANCEYPFKNCQDATQSKCYPSCNSSWSTALTNWK